MHYIIDGYNLLFRLYGDRHHLESRRRTFIQEIEKKVALLNMNVTIVFDGHFAEDEETRSHYRDLEIIYSSHGESADELILSELSSSLDPRREVVVTSDRDLCRRAKKFHSQTESSESFYRTLDQRYKKRKKKDASQAPRKTIEKPPPPVYHETAKTTQDDPLEKIFEERLKEEEKKSRRSRKKPKSKNENKIDDFKRWQRIFEERLKE